MPDSLQAELASVPSRLEYVIQDFFIQNQSRFNYGELFEPIYFDMAEYVGRKGKRVRPMLFLYTYKALGGERSLEDKALLHLAASLEFLHAFILVHDDLIDCSEMRRGLPTFHKLVEQKLLPIDGSDRIGRNVAMVAGDILFSLAVQMVNDADFSPDIKNRILGKFLSYVVDTGSGEIFDILLGVRDISRVSREDILLTYDLKTTRYTFEAPCVLGALLAGASSEKIETLVQACQDLGLAFQIQNDLAEFKQMTIEDGHLQTDLQEGKKTLLLWEAFQRLDDVHRSFLSMCLNSSRCTEATILKIRDLIERSRAVDALNTMAFELFEKAETSLRNGRFEVSESALLFEAIQNIRQQVRVYT